MGQINLEKNAETIVDNVPVFINGTYVGDYCLANLFSKWGNEDGDNLLMCEIAHRVIDIVEEKAKVEIHRCWGIHNGAGIFEISKNGKIIWKNEYSLSFFSVTVSSYCSCALPSLFPPACHSIPSVPPA